VVFIPTSVLPAHARLRGNHHAGRVAGYSRRRRIAAAAARRVAASPAPASSGRTSGAGLRSKRSCIRKVRMPRASTSVLSCRTTGLEGVAVGPRPLVCDVPTRRLASAATAVEAQMGRVAGAEYEQTIVVPVNQALQSSSHPRAPARDGRAKCGIACGARGLARQRTIQPRTQRGRWNRGHV